MKRSTLWLVPVFAVSATLWGCSSTQIRAEKAPSADLSHFHTFSWAPPQLQEQSNHLTSRPDTILEQSLKSTVDQDLEKKGLVQTPSGGDLKIAYSIRTHRNVDLEPSGFGAYYGPYWYDGVADQYYIQRRGSIVLDFIDSHTGNLVWRGIAVTDIKDTGVTPQEVQASVNKILQKFPGENQNVPS